MKWRKEKKRLKKFHLALLRMIEACGDVQLATTNMAKGLHYLRSEATAFLAKGGERHFRIKHFFEIEVEVPALTPGMLGIKLKESEGNP
jgi:hypothetical protein